MKIEAVLFDLDGVLIDATDWHYEALNRALHLFGFAITRYEHLLAYNGLPTRKKLEMLSVEKGLPVALHGVISALKQAYTRDEIVTKCRPTFDKELMISRLVREGLRLAVCSNSIRSTIELMLQQAGIREAFEFVVSNEDVSRSKPDPEIYQKAVELLGLRPETVVAIEDAPYGIEAARRAGLHVCEVASSADVDYARVRGFINRIERQQVVA